MKRKHNNIFLGFLLVLSMFLVLAGCGGGGSNNTSANSTDSTDSKGEEPVKSVTFRLGHPAPSTSVMGRSAIAFKEEIEEKTNGKVKIEIFEGSQLGGQREMTEQIKMGSLEMGIISTPNFSSYVKEFNVLDLPFLFKNEEQAYKNLDGKLGDALSQKLENVGIKPLGYWEFGYSQIINSKKPVKTPEDAKGLKIRAQPSELITDTFGSIGAEAVVMDATEVYTGLAQGIIDGVNTYYFVSVDQKEYEQAKNFSEVNLSYGVTSLIINKDIFDSLDPETQKILQEVADKHTKSERQLSQDELQKNRQFLVDNGVKIVPAEEIDMAAFRKAVEPVYTQYGKDFQELIELIEE